MKFTTYNCIFLDDYLLGIHEPDTVSSVGDTVLNIQY